MKKAKDILVLDNVCIRRIDKRTGKILDEETLHNLVVTTGKERIRDLIGEASAVGFTYMAIGEGAVSPSASDVALGNEVERESATVTYPASNQVKYEKVFNFTSGESYTITEAGLFDTAVESGSTMLNRLTFSGKAVDVDTDLSVTITITIS